MGELKQTRGPFVFDCMLNKREGPDAIELALVQVPI